MNGHFLNFLYSEPQQSYVTLILKKKVEIFERPKTAKVTGVLRRIKETEKQVENINYLSINTKAYSLSFSEDIYQFDDYKCPLNLTCLRNFKIYRMHFEMKNWTWSASRYCFYVK